MDWSMVSDNIQTAESTLKEITADNASLRESNVLQEKTFDIEVDEDLCKMRIDIPGINEAGSRTKYKNYVTENWHSFDCVIVVMDAKQGVNTEDQVELLNFVKTNLTSKKDLPVIILGNKVDEPDDYEQAILVKEVSSAVERIFQVHCRQDALKQILNAAGDTVPPPQAAFPAFVPISAIHAYIYQTASRLDFDQFKKFDKELVEKLGREVVGTRKWKRCSPEQKYKEAVEVITEPSLYKQGLEESNFNKFLAVLTYCIGGEETQRQLISKQLVVAESRLSHQTCITTQLKSIYEKSTVLGKPTDSLKETFWAVYNELKVSTSSMEHDGPTTVDKLAKPTHQLITYHKWASQLGWHDEQVLSENAMKNLVQFQMECVFQKASAWLSLDWSHVLESFLLLSFNEKFLRAVWKRENLCGKSEIRAGSEYLFHIIREVPKLRRPS